MSAISVNALALNQAATRSVHHGVQTSRPEAPPSSRDGVTQRLRPDVLLVEDDALVARDLQEILESMGCHIAVHVTTGELALAMIAVLRFDLVLMDVRLAGALDGIETAERIRERSLVPILFVTADAGKDTIARTARTQPCGYLLKPFTSRRIRAAVEAALSLGFYTGREFADTLVPPRHLDVSGPVVVASTHTHT